MSARDFTDNKIKTLLANSVAVKNALDIAVKYQAKFLHFSSSVVYGPRTLDNKLKVREESLGLVDQLSDRSCYDEGKRFSETMVFNYRQVYKIDAKIIRVFRTYGPRMALNDDQMIPDFIFNALNGDDLVIFGDENFSSSFCYVEDVIDASIKMMDSSLSGPLNIGSDVDVKISDIAKMIIEETKSSSKIKYADKKLFMSELPLSDIFKARNDLSWMPVVTLRNGIKKTIFDLEVKKQLKGFHGVK